MEESARLHQFRRYAEECVRVAQDARVTEHRTLLLDMAQRWIELAEHTSRIQGLVEQGRTDNRR